MQGRGVCSAHVAAGESGSGEAYALRASVACELGIVARFGANGRRTDAGGI